MQEGNYHKFTRAKESTEMLKMLLATGDRELVEVIHQCVVIVVSNVSLTLTRLLRAIESGESVTAQPMQKPIVASGERIGWA